MRGVEERGGREKEGRGGEGREREVNKSAWVWFDTTLISKNECNLRSFSSDRPYDCLRS